MPNQGTFWSKDEEKQLLENWKSAPADMSMKAFAEKLSPVIGRNVNSIRMKLKEVVPQVIKESPYPVFDEPLVMEGDALILPDLEMPFHHAEFVNRCLDLAEKWKIRQCILAGDVLHFATLSGWQPNWVKPENKNVISDDAEKKLTEIAKQMSKKDQGLLMEAIGNLEPQEEDGGVSNELSVTRKELCKFAERFDKIDFVLGNHCGRLLRALQTTLDPNELLRLLDVNNPTWRIAPYYFSYLISNGEKWLIDHPKSAAQSTAAILSAKFSCHVLMAHSHHFSITTDVSGKYFAAEIGCLVDESRLAYASQRHTRSPAHSLGAAIVRNGFPTILTKFTDWKSL